MRRGRITLTFRVAIAAAVVLAPAVATAGGPVGRPMLGGGAAGVRAGLQPGSVRPQGPGVRHGGSGEAVAPPTQPGALRNFVSGGRNATTSGVTMTSWVYASPVVYAVPPVYDSPSAYDAGPPVYYPPPVSYTAPVENVVVYAPSPAPPMPTVVEFATGRYELRGDGITTGYVWVWIPNPPSAPPTAPSLMPIVEEPPRAGLQPLYRWTDEAGVAHWTDRRDAVPEQHRVEAELPRIP